MIKGSASYKGCGTRLSIIITAVLMVGFGITCIGRLVYRICSVPLQEPSFSQLLMRLLHDERLFSAVNRTLFLTLMALFIQFVFVLILVRFIRKIPNILKILLISPALVSSATAALIWFLWFSPAIGPVDGWLRAHGLTPPNWFFDTLPMGSLAILVDSWQWLPFVAAVSLHQTEKIPEAFFSQASIEGASGWYIWRRITVPMLLPTFAILLILRFFDWIRLYDIIYILFGGGGAGNAMETISIYTHKLTFQPGNERYGALIAIIYLTLTLLVFICSIRVPAIKRLMPWWLQPAEQTNG